MKLTLPLKFVVPETLIDIGPRVRVTVAPETLEPLLLTFTFRVPVGSEMERFVVGALTDWFVSVVVPLEPLTAVIV